MKGILCERITPSKDGVSGTHSRSFNGIGNGINWLEKRKF